MSGRHWSAEGRRKAAVTHLALARTQNRRNGISGIFQKISFRGTKDFETQKTFYVQKQCGVQKRSHKDTKDDIQMKEAAFSGSFFSLLIPKGMEGCPQGVSLLMPNGDT